MSDVIRFIGDFSRLDLKPDDIFIIRCNQHISAETAHRLSEQFKQVFGENRKVIVLDKTVELEIRSPTGEEQ